MTWKNCVKEEQMSILPCFITPDAFIARIHADTEHKQVRESKQSLIKTCKLQSITEINCKQSPVQLSGIKNCERYRKTLSSRGILVSRWQRGSQLTSSVLPCV